MMNNKLKLFLSVLFFLLIMMGCAMKNSISFVKLQENNQTVLEKYQNLIQRYREYWNYFSKKDFRRAYDYELPYQRFLHPYSWYQEFNRPNDQSYTIILLSIHPLNDFTAILNSKYVSEDNKTVSFFKDKWILVNGRWFHKMKTSKIPLPEE